eukprot:XP_001698386.1 predicted protein [Chlamydomonas reinhardtii]
MSVVYVSWGKLVQTGWMVGGGLVLVSQAFTALQLEITRMKMHEDMKGMRESINTDMEAVRESFKAMDERHDKNMEAVRESLKAMDEKLEKVLSKTW